MLHGGGAIMNSDKYGQLLAVLQNDLTDLCFGVLQIPSVDCSRNHGIVLSTFHPPLFP